MPQVWLNGQLLAESEAAIPVSDRGFQYGEGSFTTALVKDGTVQYWERHTERLEQQARWLGFTAQAIPEGAVQALIEANQAYSGLWRLKAIQTHQTTLLLLAPYSPPTEPFTLSLRTTTHAAPSTRYKTLAYLDHSRELRNGLSILTTPEGILLEAPIANIYWRHDGSYFTPARHLPLLWGITLQRLSEQYSMEEGEYREEDISEDAELFLCNCLMGSHPARLFKASASLMDRDAAKTC